MMATVLPIFIFIFIILWLILLLSQLIHTFSRHLKLSKIHAILNLYEIVSSNTPFTLFNALSLLQLRITDNEVDQFAFRA